MNKTSHDMASVIVIPSLSHSCFSKGISFTRKGTTMTDTPTAPQPARSRAVFSQEDFSLIRTAIAHYLREVQDKPESVKYANLYHRLGRVA